MANRFITLAFLLTLCTLVNSYDNFIPTPRNPADLNAAIKHSFELKCAYAGNSGNNDGQFLEWYKDRTPIKDEKVGHYDVKTNNHETTLTIKIFVKNDSLVRTWYVTTKKDYNRGVACQFGPINLISSPQTIVADGQVLDTSHSSIQRKEGGAVNFSCNIEPSLFQTRRNGQVKWEYSADDKVYTNLPSEGIVRNGIYNISIPHVTKSHRGYYRCGLNNITFTALLRVKDQYAALWPFLGIVGVVVILVLIILIFEKRQKATRKAAATNNEDNTKDPLVRSGNKSSDNDNKKRTVKA